MKFAIANVRDVINHRIDVQVNAEAGEHLTFVRTEMDAFSLGQDNLAPHEVQYSRTFSQAGNGFTPGFDHVVKVTATNDQGISQTASRRWRDA